MEKIDTAVLPIKIEYVAKTTRNTMGEKPWECFEWRVTFSGKPGQWVVPYYCGLGHVIKAKADWMRDKPKAPTVDDVLHSLINDASASDYNLQDWCREYGYSDDSISALNTYRQCLEIATNLRKYLGADVMRQLAVQLQDH